jgi:DNA invertase Pin-like site-specific DNA recombinase
MNNPTVAIVRRSRSHQEFLGQQRLLKAELERRNLIRVNLSDFQANRDKYLKLDDRLCIYIEETLTGKTDRRKGFQWMLGEIRARRVKAVISYKADRIIRSVIAGAQLFQDCKDTGTELYSLTEKIDVNSPSGEFMFNMLMSAARYEIMLNKERSEDGKAAAKEKALKEGRVWVEGGSPPGWFAQKIIDLKEEFLEYVSKDWSNYRIKNRMRLNYTTVRKMRRMKDVEWLTREEAKKRWDEQNKKGKK